MSGGTEVALDEQSRRVIRERLDQNLFVEAGAGTGKTSALVDRVVALVSGGCPIEEIVVITFTEKAAAELRERVRVGLEAAPGGAARPAVDVALSRLDRAQISTIHAFCRSLLKRFAVEAGVDPSFEVADDVAAGQQFDEAWRAYADRLALEPEAHAAVDRTLALGLTNADLRTLATELGRHPELHELLADSPVVSASPWPSFEELESAIRACDPSSAPAEDPLRRKADALLEVLDELVGVPEDEREETLAVAAEAFMEVSFRVSNLATWGAVLDGLRGACERASAALSRALSQRRAEALAVLLPYIARFLREEAGRRGREGALVFDDLIVRVRSVLRDDPSALALARARFRALLVDEFQDTDPLQVEIALLFASGPGAGSIEPGRLFVVGDPKQSIYRFRRADMAMYADVAGKMERAGAGLQRLAVNRRSTAGVIEWVNLAFAEILGRGGDPAIQPAYHPIAAARPERPSGPAVAWFGEPLSLKAREVRAAEAAELAAQVRRILDEGWEVVGREGLRPARLRDIAVLIPTRTTLVGIERSLARAGVAHRVEGGSLVFRTQEVRDLINCLAAIADPGDEVAVVAAMRSPAFACSDQELAEHIAAGGRFNYLRTGGDRQHAVSAALDTLRAYHERLHEGSLAALVDAFAAERGLAEIGVLDVGSRSAYRRVRYVVEQARKFEATGAQSLRAFVTWLESRSSADLVDQEGAGLDDDEDALRILTVHGAKGLEFPIVILAGLSAVPMNRRGVYLVDHETGEVAVDIGASSRKARFILGDVERLAARERLHNEAEQRRLLYVAATRARDHLVISLYHGASGASATKSSAAILSPPCRAHAIRLEFPDLMDRPVDGGLDGLVVELPESDSEEIFERSRATLVDGARPAQATSATALGREQKREPGADDEPWARGRAGTRVGRAVHAAIQSVAWDAGSAEIEAIARAQAVAQAIPERSADIARHVRAALASAAAGRARAARRSLREVPFAATIEGRLVEGFIDLVIEGAEGIEIVDWKTDAVEASQVPDRLREYRLQAGLYVLGLEAATGKQVNRVCYVFVTPGAEVSPGEPRELAAEARVRLGSAEQPDIPLGGAS